MFIFELIFMRKVIWEFQRKVIDDSFNSEMGGWSKVYLNYMIRQLGNEQLFKEGIINVGKVKLINVVVESGIVVKEVLEME